MKAAIESIQRRLRANQIEGTRVEPIQKRAKLFGLIPINQEIGMEVRVPFEHQGHDNRDVPAALQHKAPDPNERLQHVITHIMLDASHFHRAKGWVPFMDKWLDENGVHVGYRAGIREKDAE